MHVYDNSTQLVGDYCLASDEQFSSYIMAKTI